MGRSVLRPYGLATFMGETVPWRKRKRDPSTARPDAPKGGAKKKLGCCARDDGGEEGRTLIEIRRKTVRSDDLADMGRSVLRPYKGFLF